ncbi:hypothetical protein PILCRDRAFT_64260, partial [Piloderma croceum F 1598]
LPNISSTQAPPNRESVAEFKEEFARIVEHEIIKGRYIGPISHQDLEALLGPFQSSPFSIIPKPGKIGKYRNVQNYSFPICPSLSFPNQSINSLVDSDSFPTTWGTFSLVSLLIHRLPPGSQLATRDVAEAYRTIPLHHSQWPATVVRLDEFSFAIDTSVCFGSGPSAGTYGEVRNAASDILRFQGIGPISSWVDDHLFFRIKKTFLPEYNERRKSWNVNITQRGRHQHGGRFWYGGHVFEDGTIEEFDKNCRFPVKDLLQRTECSAEDTLYTYNFADIDFYSLQLGIPWELSKDRPFACVTTYIGFDWDVESYQVSLGHTKKEKYLRAMEEWLVLATHTLEEVQKLYGKLLHAAIPHPLPLYDVHGYSDASSKIGIAITIRNRWRAWCLVPGWQSLDGQRDIGWAEAVAFECLIRSLVENGKETHNFIIYGDNKGVVEGWWNGHSRNRAVNGVFKRLHSVIADSPIRHSFTSYVRSKDNPANAPSRGIYPPMHLLLPPIQLPPELNRFLVDSQFPFTPTEQRLLREGRYPTAAAKRIEDSNERDKARIQHSLGALRQAEIGRDF